MIVEIVSKSGRILEVHPFTKDIITIGRAYTNDLILKDPYLDAQHLEIKFEKEAKQFLIRDCSSKNGTLIQNSNFELEAGKENAQPIGTSVHVGKSYLRFADEQQPAPAALKISKFEPTYSVLSTWWVSATLLCVLGALTLYSTYLANPFSEKIARELVNVIYSAVIALVYGGIWILLAKMQRLEGRFLFNTNLVLLLLNCNLLFELANPVLNFNFEWLISIVIFATLFSFAISAIVIFLSCVQTLHLSAKRALLISCGIGFLTVITEISNFLFPPDFQSAPTYSISMTAPSTQIRTGITEEAFLEKIQSVYETNEER